jgi:RNA polymerase sigma-70 factor (ECF subfamily)
MLLERRAPRARFDDGELVLLATRTVALGRGEDRPRACGARPRARARGAGPYVVQAAIASLHMDEPHDWPEIAALYGELAG